MCWYLGEFGSVSIDLTRQAFERVLGAPPPRSPTARVDRARQQRPRSDSGLRPRRWAGRAQGRCRPGRSPFPTWETERILF